MKPIPDHFNVIMKPQGERGGIRDSVSWAEVQDWAPELCPPQWNQTPDPSNGQPSSHARQV